MIYLNILNYLYEFSGAGGLLNSNQVKAFLLIIYQIALILLNILTGNMGVIYIIL